MRKTFSAPPLTPEPAEAANTIAWRRADIGGRDEPGPPSHVRLRHEQDGARHNLHRAHAEGGRGRLIYQALD
jgi:hypothetical protein